MKGIRKVICMMLVCIMVLGMAACGKDGESQEGSASSGKNDSSNSQLAKECVYKSEKIDLVGGAGLEAAEDNFYIEKVSYVNDRVYVLVNYTIWQNGNMGGMINPKLATASAVILPEIGVDPEFGVDEPVEYVEPIQGYRVVSFLADGSDMQYFDLDDGKKEAAEESGEGTSEETSVEDIEAGTTYSNTWFNQITFGSDGKIYAVRQSYFEDYSDPENPIFEEKNELVSWDNAGTLLWAHDINSQFEGEDYIYIRNLIVDEQGKISMILDGQNMRYASMGADGQISDVKDIMIAEGNYLNGVFADAQGNISFVIYEDNWTKQVMRPYDVSTGTLGEGTELLNSLGNFGEMMPGTYTDFVMSNNNGVYTYNLGDEEVTKVMDYVNSDLEANYLNFVTVIDEKHMVGCYSELNTYKQALAVFTKVEPEDIPDKTVLVLGANYLDSDLRERIIHFNKTNLNYRITVKDYSIYNTMDDYMASYSQLNNDILAGQMPDILMVDSQIPMANYISKGLIADIGKLIEKDEELSGEEFLKNVFEAYSVNGTLYEVVPSFNVNTMAGKKVFLGDMTGWNMEEFLQLKESLGEEVSILDPQTARASFLYQMMQFCGSDFIDSATGTCKFDSQEFINILEFAGSLPEEISYDEDFDWAKYDSQYRENRTVLMPVYLYNFRDLNYTVNGQFGGEVTMIGFPNENRNGSVLTANRTYALSAKSKALDGAWEFVRYYLTDEYQKKILEQSNAFPVNKEMFVELANEATKRPYYMDEMGNKIEYDQTIWLNDEEVIIEPMTQEEVDQYIAFVESVNRRYYYNEEVMNIITEEAAFFFEGQKPAKEVADVIQNRVRVYILENS